MKESEHIAFLEKTGKYKILQKIEFSDFPKVPEKKEFCKALILDVETTGLDYKFDEIIQISGIKFLFDPEEDNKIVGVQESFNYFQEPSIKISENITRITGITCEKTKGKKIDWSKIKELILDCEFVVAHNAVFDRMFCEFSNKEFKDIPWVCSMNQIDWESEHIKSKKLSYICFRFGFFCDFHDSFQDCVALLQLLRCSLPESKKNIFSHLINDLLQEKHRVVFEYLSYSYAPQVKKLGLKYRNKCWVYTSESEKKCEETIKEVQKITDKFSYRMFQVPICDLNSEREF